MKYSSSHQKCNTRRKRTARKSMLFRLGVPRTTYVPACILRGWRVDRYLNVTAVEVR